MESIRKMMKVAISEVFEKMFFIFLEETDGFRGGCFREAVIDFESDVNGQMRLCLSEGMLSVMARNMLVIEEGDSLPDEMMNDCAKEALNMICGHFITKTNASEKFSLSVPRLSTPGRLPEDEEVTERLFFTADCGDAALGITVAR